MVVSELVPQKNSTLVKDVHSFLEKILARNMVVDFEGARIRWNPGGIWVFKPYRVDVSLYTDAAEQYGAASSLRRDINDVGNFDRNMSPELAKIVGRYLLENFRICLDNGNIEGEYDFRLGIHEHNVELILPSTRDNMEQLLHNLRFRDHTTEQDEEGEDIDIFYNGLRDFLDRYCDKVRWSVFPTKYPSKERGDPLLTIEEMPSDEAVSVPQITSIYTPEEEAEYNIVKGKLTINSKRANENVVNDLLKLL